MKKIGQVFKYEGINLITVEQEGCKDCYFETPEFDRCRDLKIKCSSFVRKDEKSVVFKRYQIKFGR